MDTHQSINFYFAKKTAQNTKQTVKNIPKVNISSGLGCNKTA